jgi:hypothetical protein
MKVLLHFFFFFFFFFFFLLVIFYTFSLAWLFCFFWKPPLCGYPNGNGKLTWNNGLEWKWNGLDGLTITLFFFLLPSFLLFLHHFPLKRPRLGYFSLAHPPSLYIFSLLLFQAFDSLSSRIAGWRGGLLLVLLTPHTCGVLHACLELRDGDGGLEVDRWD